MASYTCAHLTAGVNPAQCYCLIPPPCRQTGKAKGCVRLVRDGVDVGLGQDRDGQRLHQLALAAQVDGLPTTTTTPTIYPPAHTHTAPRRQRQRQPSPCLRKTFSFTRLASFDHVCSAGHAWHVKVRPEPCKRKHGKHAKRHYVCLAGHHLGHYGK